MSIARNNNLREPNEARIIPKTGVVMTGSMNWTFQVCMPLTFNDNPFYTYLLANCIGYEYKLGERDDNFRKIIHSGIS